MAKPFIMSAIFPSQAKEENLHKELLHDDISELRQATREERRAADKESSEWHKGKE